MSADLFGHDAQPLAEGAWLLRGFALAEADDLLAAVDTVTAASPWRHQETPHGLRMSVAMSNCGALGWVSDRSGYRYDAIDPVTGAPWPAMPTVFARLAAQAAAAAGYAGFAPDACLINRYEAGTRLSLHQDRDERDFAQPIVSVSLGAEATFLFGGIKRNDPVRRIGLHHGDVVVWGGAARLAHHGVAPLAAGTRINLTFRRAR